MRSRTMSASIRAMIIALSMGLLTAACSQSSPDDAVEGAIVAPDGPGDPTRDSTPSPTLQPSLERPTIPDGAPTSETVAALETIASGFSPERFNAEFTDPALLEAIRGLDDIRAAWILTDILQVVGVTDLGLAADDAAERLTGMRPQPGLGWVDLTNQLLDWDVPAIDGYQPTKAAVFTLVEPQWRAFLSDGDAEVDWREVTWGGVLIDDAPLGGTCSRSCIPVLDDPAVTDAAGGAWYPDDRVVFGVEVNGEARAYPLHIMETHEVVNDTIGGRRIGLPYCTLCGSAEAYFTDDVAGAESTPLSLRTSGLLRRSNKIMYDLESGSYFDTFSGAAVSGPLQDAGVVLDRTQLTVTTWSEWRADHPDTTIVAQDGGIGATYELDPLGGRDDNGPIFPVGSADPRLPVQERVIGIEGSGGPVAFPVAAARVALTHGADVAVGEIQLVLDDDGGLVATDGGERIIHQESFWFAWSQFKPGTEVWMPEA